MKTKLVFVLFLMFVSSAIFGRQDIGLEEFKELYKLNYLKILERYSTNKEVVANITVFNEFSDNGGRTSAKNAIHRVWIISDGAQARLFFEKSTDSDVEGTYRFKTQDAVFGVARDRLNRWSIKDLKWKSQNLSDYEWCGYLNIVRIPSCAQSFNFEMFTWLNSAPGHSHSTVCPEIFDVSKEVYRGMEVAKVSGRLKAQQLDKTFVDYRCDFYLDPKDGYSTVGFSTEFHKAMGSTVARKAIMEIDYVTENGVKKYPKKYTEFAEFRDGLRVRRLEIDFVEVKDYMPTAEDFTLEKMFGLTTPDPSQVDQGLSMGSLVFWVLGAGVLVLVSVLIFLQLRKRIDKSEIN